MTSIIIGKEKLTFPPPRHPGYLGGYICKNIDIHRDYVARHQWCGKKIYGNNVHRRETFHGRKDCQDLRNDRKRGMRCIENKQVICG